MRIVTFKVRTVEQFLREHPQVHAPALLHFCSSCFATSHVQKIRDDARVLDGRHPARGIVIRSRNTNPARITALSHSASVRWKTGISKGFRPALASCGAAENNQRSILPSTRSKYWPTSTA
jgi:hypothetical protein